MNKFSLLGLALTMSGCASDSADESDPFGSTTAPPTASEDDSGDSGGSTATGDGSEGASTAADDDDDSGAGLDDGSGDDSADGDEDSGDSGDSGGDGPLLDVGGAETGTTGASCVEGDCGCTFVDLLFVIDNSGSMQDYQQGLAQVFPEFVDAMFSTLPAGIDLHVGITSTSFGSPQAGGVGSSGCSNANHNAQALADHYPPPDQPNGQAASQGRLFEHQGLTYFATNTLDDPAPLEAWFTSAAVAVGDQGSNWEMISAAAAWTAHPDNDAHNSGFLRDEGSLLVIFVLTDEYDNSPESAGTYHDLLVDAKALCGGDECIVAGGLVPPCVPNTSGNVLNDFLNSFGEAPTIGDIGGPGNTANYANVLAEVLAPVIGETCATIPPVD